MFVTGIVVQEVLQGRRDGGPALELQHLLATCGWSEPVYPETYQHAVELYRRCRAAASLPFRTLPSYPVLVANYVSKHDVTTKDLLDAIGGDVRAQLNDGVNTCAIRVSKALNDAGDPIQRMPHLHQIKGEVPAVKPHMPAADRRSCSFCGSWT